MFQITQNVILFNTFFPENRAVYEKWKSTVHPDRLQLTV